MENQTNKEQDKKKTGITAAQLDAITGGGATENVRARTHVHDTLANTGTNTSYEGPTSTSPAGTGYNSGQSATGSRITTESNYEEERAINERNEDEEDEDELEEDEEYDEDDYEDGLADDEDDEAPLDGRM